MSVFYEEPEFDEEEFIEDLEVDVDDEEEIDE